MIADSPNLGREPGLRQLLRRALRALARVYTEDALAIIACSDPMVAPAHYVTSVQE
jgi:hypothetical protein